MCIFLDLSDLGDNEDVCQKRHRRFGSGMVNRPDAVAGTWHEVRFLSPTTALRGSVRVSCNCAGRAAG